MPEEILKKEILETKKKINGLEKDIKGAKGPGAGKLQKSAQDSIVRLKGDLKNKEIELQDLTIPEVGEKEILEMIEVAASSEEVGEIEDGFEGEVPKSIEEAIANRRQELSAGPKNLKQYPELRWKKTSLEEVLTVQKKDMALPPEKRRLVGHDEKKGIALIKPEIK